MAKTFLRVCRECGHQWEVPKAVAKQGPNALEMFGRKTIAAGSSATLFSRTRTSDQLRLMRAEQKQRDAAASVRCPVCRENNVFQGPKGSSVTKAVVERVREDVASRPKQSNLISSEPTKRCPMCAEEILLAARKCKHCGELFEDAVGATPSPASPAGAAAKETAPSASQPVWRMGTMTWKCIAHGKSACQSCRALVKPPWRAGKKGDVHPAE